MPLGTSYWSYCHSILAYLNECGNEWRHEMIGLLLLVLLAGLFGYICYLVALKIGKDQAIAGIVGLLVFLLILFGGWGRVGGVTIF